MKKICGVRLSGCPELSGKIFLASLRSLGRRASPAHLRRACPSKKTGLTRQSRSRQPRRASTRKYGNMCRHRFRCTEVVGNTITTTFVGGLRPPSAPQGGFAPSTPNGGRAPRTPTWGLCPQPPVDGGLRPPKPPTPCHCRARGRGHARATRAL